MSLDKGVFGTLNLLTPHLRTIIIDTADLDDRLLWVEVCWVASLITRRTARVIQAHYEKANSSFERPSIFHFGLEDKKQCRMLPLAVGGLRTSVQLLQGRFGRIWWLHTTRCSHVLARDYSSSK